MAVMAALGATVSTMPALTKASYGECKPVRKTLTMSRKMRSFTGMKPESRVSRLGSSESIEEHFARAVLAQARAGAGSRGGAASSTCNLAAEIFPVIPIMTGLVLIGVALGFVLLRIEAAIEESE